MAASDRINLGTTPKSMNHRRTPSWRRKGLNLLISLIALATAFLAVAFLPGKVEGVYNLPSRYGCTCDSFMEWRSGRVIDHVMDSKVSMTYLKYTPNASGQIELRSLDKNEVLLIAEPHWLITRFRNPKDGTSEWRWKRFVTPSMRKKIADSPIRELKIEASGTTDILYDSRFRLIHSTFRPHN